MITQVDHINHVRDDNRFINLRKVSRNQNMQNRSFYKNNTSGSIGVIWHKRSKKWIAEIRIDGNKKHLGCYASKTEAIRARKEAEIKYKFHPNHGRLKFLREETPSLDFSLYLW